MLCYKVVNHQAYHQLTSMYLNTTNNAQPIHTHNSRSWSKKETNVFAKLSYRATQQHRPTRTENDCAATAVGNMYAGLQGKWPLNDDSWNKTSGRITHRESPESS